MFNRKLTAPGSSGVFVDPFALLSDFERVFEGTDWPAFRGRAVTGSAAWTPSLDVVEKDNRLIARIDLPGLKKEDVKVEVAEGYLTISGERKRETEEKKENFYRCEREYGSFYRAIPLPEGAKVGEVKAAFDNGVLEVSVPLAAARLEAKPRTIQIEEGARKGKAA